MQTTTLPEVLIVVTIVSLIGDSCVTHLGTSNNPAKLAERPGPSSARVSVGRFSEMREKSRNKRTHRRPRELSRRNNKKSIVGRHGSQPPAPVLMALCHVKLANSIRPFRARFRHRSTSRKKEKIIP